MNNKDILSILRKLLIPICVVIIVIILCVYFLFVYDTAPLPKIMKNRDTEQQLVKDIADKKAELERILNDNKMKSEASKKATVKEFYRVSGTGDIMTDFSPLFENIITMIKQNGLRMKSITYTVSPPDDNIVKNGGGAYSGCRVDFELVGYYNQFLTFLNELDLYPYFININRFEVRPYQYDKRILITNLSIIFYSKR